MWAPAADTAQRRCAIRGPAPDRAQTAVLVPGCTMELGLGGGSGVHGASGTRGRARRSESYPAQSPLASNALQLPVRGSVYERCALFFFSYSYSIFAQQPSIRRSRVKHRQCLKE